MQGSRSRQGTGFDPFTLDHRAEYTAIWCCFCTFQKKKREEGTLTGRAFSLERKWSAQHGGLPPGTECGVTSPCTERGTGSGREEGGGGWAARTDLRSSEQNQQD